MLFFLVVTFFMLCFDFSFKYAFDAQRSGGALITCFDILRNCVYTSVCCEGKLPISGFGAQSRLPAAIYGFHSLFLKRLCINHGNQFREAVLKRKDCPTVYFRLCWLERSCVLRYFAFFFLFFKAAILFFF